MKTDQNADASADLLPGNFSGARGTGRREASIRKANLRMGLILASIALVFFVGFVVKMVLLSRPA